MIYMEWNARQLLRVLLLQWMWASVCSYPGGAPDIACESMVPTGHGAAPQTSPPPYVISVSEKSYKPGETLEVTVYAEGEDYFRGLFLQARRIGCGFNDTKTVGVFTAPDIELTTKHCFGQVHSAVSHSSAHRKRLKVFYWTAPVLPAGHVIMRATLVREMDQFWTNVESDLVADLHSDVLPRCLPGVPSVPTTRLTPAPTSSPTSPPRQQHRPRFSNPYKPFSTTKQADENQRTATGVEGRERSMFAVSQNEDFRAVTKVLNAIREVERRISVKTPETSKKAESNDDQTSANSLIPRDGISLSTDRYPTWLGPSFNRDHRKHTTPQPGNGGKPERIPTWLIPAYQRYSSSGACSSVRAEGHTHVSMIMSAIFLVCLG